MKKVAVIDACVLFPLPLRDTLLRIAEKGLYRLCFSQKILDETTKNLIETTKMTEEKAIRYQAFMKKYFPESIIKNYEPIIPSMTNDPKDRHVLAAAIKAKADIIITYNLKDFPVESLQTFEIKAQHPDEFLINLFSDYGIGLAINILKEQVADLKNPPMTLIDLLKRLSLQAPNFVNWVVSYEYSDRLIEIVYQILNSIGYKQDNDVTVYQGKEYYLKRNIDGLIIKHYAMGEILQQTPQELYSNFSLQDLDKFEHFKEELDRQF